LHTTHILTHHFEYNTYRETWTNAIAVCIDAVTMDLLLVMMDRTYNLDKSVAVCMDMNKVESSIPTASVHQVTKKS